MSWFERNGPLGYRRLWRIRVRLEGENSLIHSVGSAPAGTWGFPVREKPVRCPHWETAIETLASKSLEAELASSREQSFGCVEDV